MGKSAATLLALAALAAGAVYLGRAYLFPVAENEDREEGVLTGALEPRLLETEILQDSELPAGVPAPAVGEDAYYLRVSILYPGLPRVPDAGDHRLVRINGRAELEREPAHVATDVDAEGARIHLLFRIEAGFQHGAIRRGKTLLLDSIPLE